MIQTLTTIMENLEAWVLALASSVWIFPAVFAFATIDGFFPPIPSESVVITLAAFAHTAGVPNIALIGLVAAAGAWTGDQIAFHIGRLVGTDRVRFLRTPKGRATVAWARQALSQRGASFIFSARYIPIGRVAVNMTAGAVGYSRKRFMVFSAIAGASWALYSVAIGFLAAQLLGDQPVLAMVVGVVFGIITGFVIDRVLSARRRREISVPDDAATVPASASSPVHGPVAVARTSAPARTSVPVAQSSVPARTAGPAQSGVPVFPAAVLAAARTGVARRGAVAHK